MRLGCADEETSLSQYVSSDDSMSQVNETEKKELNTVDTHDNLTTFWRTYVYNQATVSLIHSMNANPPP